MALPWHLDPGIRDRLVAAYSQPHRGYHDLRHLTEVLENLDEIMPADHPGRDAVVLAAWFHDAVYDSEGANEERSARLAARELAGLADVDEVTRLVLLTRTHRPAATDTNGGYLCDADLAILAAGPERYREYVTGVRKEYADLPDADFAAGRAAILRDLLAKESLFFTDEARERWEAKARANIEAELTSLG